MDRLIIVGFVCLLLLVLFYMFFMKKKWFNYAFKAILIGVAVYIIYVGVIVVDKYIREEKTTYTSIEEVIEKNYKGAEVTIANSGSYYYLIIEKNDEQSETKEELIRFENNKFTAFDAISRLSMGIKRNNCEVYSAPLASSTRIEYKYDDVFVVIIKRKSNFTTLNIYDDYGPWDFVLAEKYYYYINVIEEDEISNEYKVFAATEFHIYELVKSSLYDGYNWVKVVN